MTVFIFTIFYLLCQRTSFLKVKNFTGNGYFHIRKTHNHELVVNVTVGINCESCEFNSTTNIVTVNIPKNSFEKEETDLFREHKFEGGIGKK